MRLPFLGILVAILSVTELALIASYDSKSYEAIKQGYYGALGFISLIVTGTVLLIVVPAVLTFVVLAILSIPLFQKKSTNEKEI